MNQTNSEAEDVRERMLLAAQQAASATSRHPEYERPKEEPVKCQDTRYTAPDSGTVGCHEAKAYLLCDKTGPTVMWMTPRKIAEDHDCPRLS